MRVFFIGTLKDINQHNEIYNFVIDKIKKIGHKVDSDLSFVKTESQLDGLEEKRELLAFHKKLIEGIKKCDVFVVDVTVQRVSTGYWISLALDLGKPVIALCKKGTDHHLLRTLEISQKFTLYQYDDLVELGKEIPLLLDFASDQQDTRFNFFISPKHQNYLDWIAKYKKIPRSVYLRELIETDMASNSEYIESSILEDNQA